MFDVADNTDHGRHLLWAWAGHPDLFAERIFIGEELPRQKPRSKSNARRFGMVALVEGAARAQRNAHRAEIIWLTMPTGVAG